MVYSHVGPQSQSPPSYGLTTGYQHVRFKDIDRYLGRGVMVKLSMSILNQFLSKEGDMSVLGWERYV